MSLKRMILFCVVFCLLLLPFVASAGKNEGNVKGTVHKNSASGKVLSGVKVKCGGEDDKTGDDGKFKIKGINKGEHTLKFSKDGYESYEMKVKIKAGETANVGDRWLVEKHTVTSCPSGNGLYCGEASKGQNTSDLYKCKDGHYSHEKSCSNGCKRNSAGKNDECNPSSGSVSSSGSHSCPSGNGLYCGESAKGQNPSDLYKCKDGHYSHEKACGNGCQKNAAGKDDSCKPATSPAPTPTPAQCPSGNGLYCGDAGKGQNTAYLYHCTDGKYSLQSSCGNGCQKNAAGKDDSCKPTANPAPTPTPAKCPSGNGLYCGDTGKGQNASNLYQCTNGNYSLKTACSNGCQKNAAGKDDSCKSISGPNAGFPSCQGIADTHCKSAKVGDQYQCTTYVQQNAGWNVGQLGTYLNDKKNKINCWKPNVGAPGSVVIMSLGTYGHVGLVRKVSGKKITIGDRNLCCDGKDRQYDIATDDSKILGFYVHDKNKDCSSSKSLNEDHNTGSISGRIHANSESGTLLSNVKVECGGKSYKTGDDGKFKIKDIAAGDHTIKFSKDGYENYEKKVQIKAGLTTNMHERWLIKTSSPGDGSGSKSCPSGNGLYCGDSAKGYNPSDLYRCKDGKYSLEKTCSNGCQKNASGKDDSCLSGNTPPPSAQYTPNLNSTAYTNENPLYKNGYEGHCTWFAWGRAAEVMGNRTLPTTHANTWWGKAINFEKGQVPRKNSIVVWSQGKYGHVAYVEDVLADGRVIINEANYNPSYTTNKGAGYLNQKCPKTLSKNEIKSHYKGFSGYIYLTSNDTRNTGSVSGKVYKNSVSSKVALSDVKVECGGKSDRTDDKGEFKIKDVPVGNQSIAFSKPGYKDYFREVEVKAGTNAKLDDRWLVEELSIKKPVVIFIDGMCLSATIRENTKSCSYRYLEIALQNELKDFTIATCDWKGDVKDTLITTLTNEYKRVEDCVRIMNASAIKQDKNTVIVGHSWGSVLAYKVLKNNPDVKIKSFISMGSPLNLEKSIIHPTKAIVYGVTKIQIQEVNKLANVNKWTNYWADDDKISGVIDSADQNFQVDKYIKITANPHSIYFQYYKSDIISKIVAD